MEHPWKNLLRFFSTVFFTAGNIYAWAVFLISIIQNKPMDGSFWPIILLDVFMAVSCPSNEVDAASPQISAPEFQQLKSGLPESFHSMQAAYSHLN